MTHEELARQEQVEVPADKSFGFVFAAVFLIVAAWPLLHGVGPRWWACGLGAMFAVIALLKPALLSPLNRSWIKLGLLLGKIVSPIALALMLYCVFTPIAFLMRLARKDPLRLKLSPEAKSYWIRRDPPGPGADSMKNQF